MQDYVDDFNFKRGRPKEVLVKEKLRNLPCILTSEEHGHGSADSSEVHSGIEGDESVQKLSREVIEVIMGFDEGHVTGQGLAHDKIWHVLGNTFR